MPSSPSARPFDLVLVGASGFVGRLVAAELAGQLALSAGGALQVALAGRNPRRLAAVAAGIPGAEGWPRLEVDVLDQRAAWALAERSRVIVTTVGPYLRLGFPLAAACAAVGTDYCDLTGEVLFVRRCVEQLHDQALAQGARLVHACGYDSVPSDLAVLLAAQAAAADGAGELSEAVLVARGRGGLSGGTIASYRVQLEALEAAPETRAVVRDPFALCPEPPEPAAGDPRTEADWFRPHWDPLVGGWVAPFVMAPFNTRIVRRSNALLGFAWGRRLRYREATGGRSGPLGALEAGALGVGQTLALAAFGQPRVRRWLEPLVPAPGQGPGAAQRARGWFRSELHAQTTTGARYRSLVAGRGDPGYAATAVLLTQAALGLALDRDRLPAIAGVLTPASALGRVLVDRLRRRGLELQAQAIWR